jgi:hypothetical protein
MKNFFKATLIPIAIAALTCSIVYYYSFYGSGSPGDKNSFKSVFVPLGIFSFVSYLILLGISILIIRHFKLSMKYIYIGHIVAFLIGYFLFYGAFLSGGLGSGIL